MHTKTKFEKEAFGNSKLGRIISGLELAIAYFMVIFLLLILMLRPALSSSLDDQEIHLLSVKLALFPALLGFCLGFFKFTYPIVCSNFITPTITQLENYQDKKLKKCSDEIVEMRERKERLEKRITKKEEEFEKIKKLAF